MKMFLVAAVVLLTGCYGLETSSIDRHHVREVNDIPGHVFDFRLEDGTRCVAWSDGIRTGGLSCDFRSAPVEKAEAQQPAVFRNGFAYKG